MGRLFARNMGCGRVWEWPVTCAADGHGKVCLPCACNGEMDRHPCGRRIHQGPGRGLGEWP
eukprot:3080169-Prorocentrum_lima.AAC.1